MKLASSIFNQQQKQRIEQTVIEAEVNTSCEIVPIVATTSGGYDRSEDIIGLWLVAFAAVMVWLMFPLQASEPGSWADRSVLGGGLVMLVVVFNYNNPRLAGGYLLNSYTGNGGQRVTVKVSNFPL